MRHVHSQLFPPEVHPPTPKRTRPPFAWDKTCSYDEAQKAAFHRAAKLRLKDLAALMRWDAGTFDLRSNKAGIAVSGEVTLHHERIYIQASQSCMGGDNGILIRTCNGQKDYHGGRNNFAPLRLLDDLEALADQVRKVMDNDGGRS